MTTMAYLTPLSRAQSLSPASHTNIHSLLENSGIRCAFHMNLYESVDEHEPTTNMDQLKQSWLAI